MIRHIRRWNYWRKHNVNGHIHHFLVLIGFIESPTFNFTILPEEVPDMDKYIQKLKEMNTDNGITE